MGMLIRFANDYGHDNGLWQRDGTVDEDFIAALPADLAKRLRRQGEIFNFHFDCDTGAWNSDQMRQIHYAEVMQIAKDLRALLPEHLAVEHWPWEHGSGKYIVPKDESEVAVDSNAKQKIARYIKFNVEDFGK